MSVTIKTNQLSYKKILEYIRANCSPTKNKNILKVNTALKVWKRTDHVLTGGKVIVALEIPIGALIRIQKLKRDSNVDIGLRKFRASKAKVKAQYWVSWTEDLTKWTYGTGTKVFDVGCYLEVKESESNYEPDFFYKTNCTVKPTEPFSLLDASCRSGIHFFVNLSDALKY